MEINDELRAAIKGQLTAKPAPRERENVSCYRYNNGRGYHSDALGVNPEQIGEARDELRKHGLAVEFDKEGRCIVESEKQFQDVSRALGMRSGREGYQVHDDEGKRIFSGREQAQGQEQFKEHMRRIIREG